MSATEPSGPWAPTGRTGRRPPCASIDDFGRGPNDIFLASHVLLLGYAGRAARSATRALLRRSAGGPTLFLCRWLAHQGSGRRRCRESVTSNDTAPPCGVSSRRRHPQRTRSAPLPQREHRHVPAWPLAEAAPTSMPARQARTPGAARATASKRVSQDIRPTASS